MRVFVTGASGWIGTAVLPELVRAGHEVVGLARSDDAAAKVRAAGATPRRGSLDDLDGLREGAADSDGVIHLAFIHDFARFAASARADVDAIEAIGSTLAGSDRPLVIAAGVAGLSVGRVATERDMPDPASSPRVAGSQAALGLADHGVRSSVVRLAPTVHGDGDTGFIATMVGMDRENGVAGYLGDGTNRWAAVHRLDAALLFRLAVESAPAGSVLHGIADEGVPIRRVAEIVGGQLGLPVEPVAEERFGWLAQFLALDMPASSAITQELLGWTPTHPTLLDDLEAGYYTR